MNNLSPEEIKDLLEKYKDNKKWLIDNAPEEISESYRVLFCLVEIQNNMLLQLTGDEENEEFLGGLKSLKGIFDEDKDA